MLKIILTGPESCGKTTLARQLATHFDVPLVEEYVREYFDKKQTSRRKIGTGSQYKEGDLKKIAKGQVAAEKKIENVLFKQLTRRKDAKKPPFFICDTDVLTIKIWSEEKYGRCDKWIMEQFEISKVIAKHEAARFQRSAKHSGNFESFPNVILQTSNLEPQTLDIPALQTSNFKLQTLYLLCSPDGIEWEADPLRENPNDRERLFKVYEKELILYEKDYKILRGGIGERFEDVKNILLAP